ncbi:hypothetical protein QOZ95_002015 [Paenibacillus brasilensis]|uniref:Uncharacterized protein n=1 Tax=Paenibacillus brasilensis TaxID=128574 RepID=A0ABU0L032_9BACL|nr:hypothetical protein [Paenibacillus brasilensis]
MLCHFCNEELESAAEHLEAETGFPKLKFQEMERINSKNVREVNKVWN